MDLYTSLPTCIDDTRLHKELYLNIKKVLSEGDFNILLYGARGIGKKTLIHTVINEVYPNKSIPYEKTITGVYNAKQCEENIFITETNHYIELNCDCIRNNHKFVVSKLLGEQSKNLTLSENLDIIKKIVILYEFDKLNANIQHMLRKLIESYQNLMFVITSSCMNKIIDPIKSRFACIRVNQQKSELETLLKHKCEVSKYPKNCVKRLLNKESGDISQCILKVHKVNVPNYDDYIETIIKYIMGKHSDFESIRKTTYDLIGNNISPNEIVKRINKEILMKTKHKNTSTKHLIIEWAAHCEHQLHLCVKSIIILELYINRLHKIIM